MHFSQGSLLDVYNRGNNKQNIFFNQDNYRYFIKKVKLHIANNSDIIAYCLMPNHFHFLLHLNERSCRSKRIGLLESNELQNGFWVLQSSYANAINKEFKRTGSLFQQNTKFKLLNDDSRQFISEDRYAETCLHYIHQNPLKAGLVNKLEDWEFSSFREYIEQNGNRICKKELAWELFDIKPQQFYKFSYDVIDPVLLDKIW